jgi:hypothetical protein
MHRFEGDQRRYPKRSPRPSKRAPRHSLLVFPPLTAVPFRPYLDATQGFRFF